MLDRIQLPTLPELPSPGPEAPDPRDPTQGSFAGILAGVQAPPRLPQPTSERKSDLAVQPAGEVPLAVATANASAEPQALSELSRGSQPTAAPTAENPLAVPTTKAPGPSAPISDLPLDLGVQNASTALPSTAGQDHSLASSFLPSQAPSGNFQSFGTTQGGAQPTLSASHAEIVQAPMRPSQTIQESSSQAAAVSTPQFESIQGNTPGSASLAVDTSSPQLPQETIGSESSKLPLSSDPKLVSTQPKESGNSNRPHPWAGNEFRNGSEVTIEKQEALGTSEKQPPSRLPPSGESKLFESNKVQAASPLPSSSPATFQGRELQQTLETQGIFPSDMTDPIDAEIVAKSLKSSISSQIQESNHLTTEPSLQERVAQGRLAEAPLASSKLPIFPPVVRREALAQGNTQSYAPQVVQALDGMTNTQTSPVGEIMSALLPKAVEAAASTPIQTLHASLPVATATSAPDAQLLKDAQITHPTVPGTSLEKASNPMNPVRNESSMLPLQSEAPLRILREKGAEDLKPKARDHHSESNQGKKLEPSPLPPAPKNTNEAVSEKHRLPAPEGKANLPGHQAPVEAPTRMVTEASQPSPQRATSDLAPGVAQPSSNQASNVQTSSSLSNAQALPPNPIIAQLQGGVRWLLQGGRREAELQLHPENLGQLRIQIRVEGSEVSARIFASVPEAIQAIQDGKSYLELNLKNQGMSLGGLDVQLGHAPQQNPFRQTFTPSLGSAASGPVLDMLPIRQESPIGAVALLQDGHQIEYFA